MVLDGYRQTLKVFFESKLKSLIIHQKPATEIASNMALPFFACPIMNWQPVVEPDFGQERFLTDEPNVLFSNGNFSRVPVIVGITADEFISPIAGM